MQHTQNNSMLRGSRNANSIGCNNNSVAGRSFKEVVKVFVQMMVEDIWAYYEGFAWQKKVLLQSEEKKKKRQLVNQTSRIQAHNHQ